MPTIEYITRPQGKVLGEYASSWGRVEAIMGPLGSGKTVQSCQKLFDAMCRQEPNSEGVRPSRWYAVRNTYSDLLTTTTKDWLELYQELGRYSEGNKKPPTHTLDFDLEDGTTVKSEVVFIALDRPDSVKKLRGSQVTGFWLNEMKELPKAIVDMADLRHGRYPSMAAGGVDCTWHGMIGDTNAPDDDHWYYNLAEVVKPKGWNFHRQPGGLIRIGDKYKVNPDAENIQNLPDGYYETGMEGKDADWINVNLCNEYGSYIEGKQVYPQFSEQMHVAKDHFLPVDGADIALGWDFGLTPACIIGQLMPNGQVRIISELVADDMDVKRFARDVVKPYLQKHFYKHDIAFSYADPAGNNRGEGEGKTTIGILNDEYLAPGDEPLDMGFYTEPAPTNDPSRRIDSVATFLRRLVSNGVPAFVIDKRCKVLIKGFKGGYCYKRLKVSGSEERFRDKPDKNRFSHPHDALQYLCLGFAGGYVVESQEYDYNDDYRETDALGY